MSSDPTCFGHLFDSTDAACGSCLVRDRCERVLRTGSAFDRQPVNAPPPNLPEDKKLLILLVCQKFGIPTTYREKRGNKQEYTATPENAGDFHNLDFLITTKEALRKMLGADE